MNLDHLMWDENGWGYLPPSDEVFAMIDDVKTIINPKSMLEIGFYAGHSTTYFAEKMPDCKIASCCPYHPRGVEYGPIMEKLYPNVSVYLTPSPTILYLLGGTRFDFIFIDGNHGTEDVQVDTEVSIKFKTPYMLYDNTELSSVQEGLTKFVEDGRIELLNEWNYTATFKDVTKVHGVQLYKNMCL